VVHNVRSCHNVGSLLRTADGLGLHKVFLTGYTPYPKAKDDPRLPHQRSKTARQIHKTSLGAEHSVHWDYQKDILALLANLKSRGFAIVALEQSAKSGPIESYSPPDKLALIVGREIGGIEPEILGQSDQIIEIPMHGQKESFNVAVAAAIALYTLVNKR
jgi:tRNA G18 (ribose-2'-O)-methylase SpoU